MHVSVVIADLGRFLHLPLTSRQHDTALVFCDHRHTLDERRQRVESAVDITDNITFDVTELMDVEFDCYILHRWEPLTTTSVRCADCGTTRPVNPYPMPYEKRWVTPPSDGVAAGG